MRCAFDHLYVDATAAPAKPRDIVQIIELAQPRLSSGRFSPRHFKHQDGKAGRRQTLPSLDQRQIRIAGKFTSPQTQAKFFQSIEDVAENATQPVTGSPF